MGSFRAMGTEVTVLAPHESEHDEAALTERVAAVFEDAERRFSRFRVDSELSALNRAEGEVRVSREMLDTLISMSTCKNIRVETDSERLRPIDADLQVPDTRKFENHTGWKPTISFEQTMTDLLEYWRDRTSQHPHFLTR